MSFDGRIAGTCVKAKSLVGISGVKVKTSERTQYTDTNGNFIMFHPTGTYDITFSKKGYTSVTMYNVYIQERISGVDYLGNIRMG
jgi:hypothetical protein